MGIMEKSAPLFTEAETKDNSPLAIRDTDTMLQRMSKKYLRFHQYNGDTASHLITYQMGAKQAIDAMLKLACKDCPCKSECNTDDKDLQCSIYESYKKVISK